MLWPSSTKQKQNRQTKINVMSLVQEQTRSFVFTSPLFINCFSRIVQKNARPSIISWWRKLMKCWGQPSPIPYLLNKTLPFMPSWQGSLVKRVVRENVSARGRQEAKMPGQEECSCWKTSTAIFLARSKQLLMKLPLRLTSCSFDVSRGLSCRGGKKHHCNEADQGEESFMGWALSLPFRNKTCRH